MAAACKSLPQSLAQVWRRRFLDHLLIAPLQRTIALAQRNDAALAVAEDLHLDVARRRDETLEVKPRIAEICRGKAAHALEAFRCNSSGVQQSCMPMPPPPAVLLSMTG